MVEISDIKDSDTLEAWLEKQPPEIAVWIAGRAAARVLPIWWLAVLTRDWAHITDLTGLPVLRSLLISSVAARVPTNDIALAADAADVAATEAADAADAAGDAAAATAAAATAATDATSAKIVAGHIRGDAAYAATAAAYAATANAATAADIWSAISRLLKKSGLKDKIPAAGFGRRAGGGYGPRVCSAPALRLPRASVVGQGCRLPLSS